MSVGRICVREVRTADPSESVRHAARRMAEHGVGSLVVLDEEKIPIGMLTDRDVLVRCVVEGKDPDRMRVAETMTSPVAMAREDMPIEDALSEMTSCHVRRMPVVDAKDHLVGILSVDDVIDLLAEETSTLGELLRGGR